MKTPRAKPPKPTAADRAMAQQLMRSLGKTELYGTGDGNYFTTRQAAADYNCGNTQTLISYPFN
ncbi:hypothetical protein [Hymenobacter sp. CRA2]|uniref:hypothetical protein n=1 Tax=Hymenobacter sp. CRA2 TaxID=1955620 RepID=UPI0009900630|nr:hypothetical protein [Hymenobacter sp. CRA2]OON67816.1 hypothetical protein B0919_16660 [Hymenobacter sp. CRA2]